MGESGIVKMVGGGKRFGGVKRFLECTAHTNGCLGRALAHQNGVWAEYETRGQSEMAGLGGRGHEVIPHITQVLLSSGVRPEMCEVETESVYSTSESLEPEITRKEQRRELYE